MTKQGDATIKNTAEKIVNSRISEFFQIVDDKIIAIIATQCEKWVLCKVEHLCIYSFKSVNSMYFYCMHAIMIPFFVIIKQRTSNSLREMCPNKGLLLIRIFLHSDWIRRFTLQISVFSQNAGKYGPEITPHQDTFHAVIISYISPISPSKDKVLQHYCCTDKFYCL